MSENTNDQILMAFGNLFSESQTLTNHVLLSKTTWETLKSQIVAQLNVKEEMIQSLQKKLQEK
jgi:hypothetical protein